MAHLFYGNFAFEHELADDGRHRSESARRREAELASLWVTVARQGDSIWTPTAFEPGLLERLTDFGFPRVNLFEATATDLEFCPWGWSAAAAEWAKRHGVVCRPPSLEAVRDLNSRRFSHRWEQEHGLAVGGAAEVESLVDLEKALTEAASHGSGWLVKAEFGMAGREQIAGKGSLQPQQVKWAEKRLRRDGRLFIEPRLNRIAEAGLCFEVSDQDSQFIGGAELMADSNGQFRASRPLSSAEIKRWGPAITAGQELCQQARDRGYRGPLGLDAMQYRTKDGQVRLRCLQDLNARYTMGRFALGLRRTMKSEAAATLMRVRWPSDPDGWLQSIERSLSGAVRLVRLTPIRTAEGSCQAGVVSLLSTEPEFQRECERRLCG